LLSSLHCCPGLADRRDHTLMLVMITTGVRVHITPERRNLSNSYPELVIDVLAAAGRNTFVVREEVSSFWIACMERGKGSVVVPVKTYLGVRRVVSGS
jgi:hypothetical protein